MKKTDRLSLLYLSFYEHAVGFDESLLWGDNQKKNTRKALVFPKFIPLQN